MSGLEKNKQLNVLTDIRRMPVIYAHSEKLGEVEDVLLHPTVGEIIGLIVKSDHGEKYLLDGSFHILGHTRVIHTDSRPSAVQTLPSDGALVCGDLLGTNVITQDGDWIGYVCEVRIGEKQFDVYYRIVESKFQKLVGGGFWLKGDAPRYYSRAGCRLIVSRKINELKKHPQISLAHSRTGLSGQVERDKIAQI